MCDRCAAHCPDAACGGAAHVSAYFRARARARPSADVRSSRPPTTGAPQSATQPRLHQPATVGTWILEMLRAHGGCSLAAAPAGVATAHKAALDEHRRVTVTKANQGSSAPVRCLVLLQGFATHRKVLHQPWSLDEVDALVMDFCQARMKPLPAVPAWGRGVKAPAARGISSTIAAASRRSGCMVPEFCGARCQEWSAAAGGKAKPEHSAAWPLHLPFILSAEPPRSDPAWTAWAGLALMSIFCLRTGIVQHLTRHMFIPYDGGYVLVWRHSQKRTGATDDATDPDHLSRIGSVSAARHPALTRILGNTAVGPNDCILPGLTSESMSAFVHQHVPGCPAGFDIRTYGARVAADQDATELALPDAETAVMFWWKRGALGMRHYYSGINLRRLFLFTERRSSIQYNHIANGNYDAIIPSADLRKWDDASVGTALPDPPSWATIARAMSATSPSFIAAINLRAEVRRVRARRAAGESSTESDSGTASDTLRGTCTKCRNSIPPDAEASVCTRCKLMICTKCRPDTTIDWRCPAHQAPAPKRRRK